MAEDKLSRPLSVNEVQGLPEPGDGSGLSPDERFYREEVQLALRNRGVPLELMREPITPSGLHYLLVHFDIPAATAEPVSLIKPRALMIPPGIPDFPSRTRVLRAGSVTLQGRAWVGRGRIERVEVSTDDGHSWHDAELEPPVSRLAWRGWSSRWQAAPGRYTLGVRATDDQGRTQPLDQPWNYQGMANNMVQRVPVVVV